MADPSVSFHEMRRTLLILASVLLLLGLYVEVAQGPLTAWALAASEGCHCCPDDEADSEGEEADCCDWDFGVCCPTATAAALPTAEVARAVSAATQPESSTILPLHILRPRANGPPPTPPPIG